MGTRIGVDDQLCLLFVFVSIGIQPQGSSSGRKANHTSLGNGHYSNHTPSAVYRAGDVERGPFGNGGDEFYGVHHGVAHCSSCLFVLEWRPSNGGRTWREFLESQGDNVGVTLSGNMGGKVTAS